MSATFSEARSLDSDWIGFLKRELRPTRLREIRTAIMVVGTVLCVIISMALQVPELALSAYMIFFLSKETKALTTKTGVGGLIGVTIAVGITLELFKFTYGHPELRIPAIGITLFLGMWLSRIFVIGPLGLILGFLLSYTQSIVEQIPIASPELVVRASLWVWVAIAYGAGLTIVLNQLFLPTPAEAQSPRPKPKVCGSPTRLLILRTSATRSKSLLPRCFVTSHIQRLTGPGSTPRSSPVFLSDWKALKRRFTKERYESSAASSAGRLRLPRSYSSCRLWRRSRALWFFVLRFSG